MTIQKTLQDVYVRVKIYWSTENTCHCPWQWQYSWEQCFLWQKPCNISQCRNLICRLLVYSLTTWVFILHVPADLKLQVSVAPLEDTVRLFSFSKPTYSHPGKIIETSCLQVSFSAPSSGLALHQDLIYYYFILFPSSAASMGGSLRRNYK